MERLVCAVARGWGGRHWGCAAPPRRNPRSRYGAVMDRISLTVPSGAPGAGVVALVLGGLGSRLDLGIDRIDELVMATNTIGGLGHGASLEVEVSVLDDRLVLAVGPLLDGAAANSATRRIVEPLVDALATTERDGREWLELELVRGKRG